MSLQLTRDASWPFGGTVLQRLTVTGRLLRLELSLTAGKHAMPRPVLGWHPWFQKPTRLDFTHTRCYPRDREGIATLPLGKPPPGPWDDCFINTRAVVLHRGHQSLRLTSECEHWVVFDGRPHATCVEPQTGPPDAFNLAPKQRLEPGETIEAWFLLHNSPLHSPVMTLLCWATAAIVNWLIVACQRAPKFPRLWAPKIP